MTRLTLRLYGCLFRSSGLAYNGVPTEVFTNSSGLANCLITHWVKQDLLSFVPIRLYSDMIKYKAKKLEMLLSFMFRHVHTEKRNSKIRQVTAKRNKC